MLASSIIIAPSDEASKNLPAQPAQQGHTEHNPIVTAWEFVFPDSISLFTAALVLATIALWRATMRIAKDTRTSGEIQADKMERSAVAMEGVSASMAINAAKIVESVAMQRLFGKLQMRAYFSVLIGKARYQDQNFFFEARPQMVNSGHTAARKVRWRISADILPKPLPDGWKFRNLSEMCGGSDLPPHQDGYMSFVVKQRFDDKEAEATKLGFGTALTVWGVVFYKDVFGRDHRRTFAQQLWWEPSGKDAEGNWQFTVEGLYLPQHNKGT